MAIAGAGGHKRVGYGGLQRTSRSKQGFESPPPPPETAHASRVFGSEPRAPPADEVSTEIVVALARAFCCERHVLWADVVGQQAML